jgi:hypothetical protein
MDRVSRYIPVTQHKVILITLLVNIYSTLYFDFLNHHQVMISNTKVIEVTSAYNSSVDVVWCLIDHQILECNICDV